MSQGHDPNGTHHSVGLPVELAEASLVRMFSTTTKKNPLYSEVVYFEVPGIIMRQGRESEATVAVFLPIGQKPLHTGVRTGCHFPSTLAMNLFIRTHLIKS